MMVHLATVRTTLGVTNSSPILSLMVQVPHATSWQQYGLIVKSNSSSAEAFPYGLFTARLFRLALRAPQSSLVFLPSLFVFQRGFQMTDLCV